MLLPDNRRRIRPPLPPPPAHVYVSLPHPSLSPPSLPALVAHSHTRRYPQIEKNKSVHLSQFFTGSYATGGALRDSGFEFDDEKWTHLEACFPFDPFQLPVAKRWLDLESSYVAWRPMALLDREGEEEEGEEESEDEEDSEFEGGDGGEGGVVGSFQEDTATDDEGGEGYA